ncbi:FecR family protein [Pedobacter immunditicola]|uniref:FecR family protein n=1 Tax=Pedobacter immunditicola TaxID=3133440 RepID=UPI0030B53F58
MKNDYLTSLIEKHLQGKTSLEEENLLNDWYDSHGNISPDWDEQELGSKAHTGQKLWDKISSEIDNPADQPRLLKFPKLFIAASVTIFFCFTLYLLLNNNQKAIATPSSLKPGKGQAMLTLADGSTLNLKNAENVVIANQPGSIINKMADGKLVYTHQSGAQLSNTVSYNTIQTPRASQYQVTLVDGTSVWLNAETSLTYPTQFSEKERVVRLIGQAYFEVAPDEQKPFKVITDKQEVVVLGTHFDINAYPDETSVKTSLIEGSIKVIAGNKYGHSAILKPGQQSVMDKQQLKVHDFDNSEGIGWKQGYFYFNNEDMKDAMRQLARWYDVEVSYIGNADQIKFGGSFSKSDKLEDILKILEATKKFKCKKEGRRITIIL